MQRGHGRLVAILIACVTVVALTGASAASAAHETVLRHLAVPFVLASAPDGESVYVTKPAGEIRFAGPGRYERAEPTLERVELNADREPTKSHVGPGFERPTALLVTANEIYSANSNQSDERFVYFNLVTKERFSFARDLLNVSGLVQLDGRLYTAGWHGRIYQLNPREPVEAGQKTEVARVPVSHGVAAITVNEGAILAATWEGAIYRIDPKLPAYRNVALLTTGVGRAICGIEVVDGAIYVITSADGKLSRVDLSKPPGKNTHEITTDLGPVRSMVKDPRNGDLRRPATREALTPFLVDDVIGLVNDFANPRSALLVSNDRGELNRVVVDGYL